MTTATTFSNSFEDERTFRELSFKCTMAWDKKDLATFLEITAAEIVPDYSNHSAGPEKVEKVSPEEFFKGAFSLLLGHPDLKTQHFLGACMFNRISESEAKGSWQVRAWHVRKFEDGVRQWDTSAYVDFTYVKIGNGEWKIGGWRPHSELAQTGKHDGVIGVI